MILGVLLPGSEVACASSRRTDWGAQVIIQEVGCGKDGFLRPYKAGSWDHDIELLIS